MRFVVPLLLAACVADPASQWSVPPSGRLAADDTILMQGAEFAAFGQRLAAGDFDGDGYIDILTTAGAWSPSANTMPGRSLANRASLNPENPLQIGISAPFFDSPSWRLLG